MTKIQRAEYDAKRYAANGDNLRRLQRERDKVRRYGITQTEYDRMYAEQQGCCAVCTDHHEVLHIDHNHSNNEVRKLLCHRCNTGIGLLRENPEILQKAIIYLLSFGAA